MSVRFERVAKILIPDENEQNFSWWAHYLWDESKQRWRCTDANAGFHTQHDLGWELTEQEMTLVVMRYA